jgi:AcrR family transcriptional regulator
LPDRAFCVYTVYVRQADTAERILREARALLDREGPEAVSMREVAAAVRITPMAIYRHYRGRDALLGGLAEEGFAALAAQLERRMRRARTPEAALAAFFDAYLEFAERHPHRFELMFGRERPGARRWPADFAARRSPTGNLVLVVLARAMPGKGEAALLEAALALWGQAHGLIALWRAGRVGMERAAFRRVYRRLLAKVLDGHR